MTGRAVRLGGAAVALVLVLVLLRSALENDDGGPALGDQSRAASKHPQSAGAKLIGDRDPPQPLASVEGVGRFSATCRGGGRLAVTFRSSAAATLQIVVDARGRAARAHFVDPGESLTEPAVAAVLAQRWQLTSVTATGGSVAVVDLAASPSSPIGGSGCLASIYTLGPSPGK